MDFEKTIYLSQDNNQESDTKIFYKKPELINSANTITEIKISEELFNEIQTCSYEEIKKIIILIEKTIEDKIEVQDFKYKEIKSRQTAA